MALLSTGDASLIASLPLALDHDGWPQGRGGQFCRGTYAENTTVLTQKKYDNIVLFLKTKRTDHIEDGKSSKFKWWVREKKFQLVNFPGLDLNDVLCIPSKQEVSS